MAVVVPLAAYVVVFGGAALACFAALVRAARLADDETRRGLVALLATSGAWSASHAGVFLVPGVGLKTLVYLVGLTFGFTTVFAWLYFCSAYTGRSYHRDPRYRRLAAGVLLAVLLVKFTNPIHHQYFTTDFSRTPFPHLIVDQKFVHWVITGLSYSLASVGLFALFEYFARAEYDTRGLRALLATMVLPVGLDVVGYGTPNLVNIIYAPLGVAVFTVGVLVVYRDRFFAVQLTGDVDDAILFLDDDGRLRDYNAVAAERFPGLADAIGEPVEAVLGFDPEDASGEVRRLDHGGVERFYLVSRTPFRQGQSAFGQLLMFTDVTAIERRRREVDRLNEQLADFAVGMRHELRNTLQIIDGHADRATREVERGNVADARHSLRTVSETADRMTDQVDGFAALAQYGRTIEDAERVDVAGVAREAWEATETGGMELVLTGETTVETTPERLRELFANAFRFAARNDASTVTVEATADGFSVTDDGDPLDPAATDGAFEYGFAVPDAETGMLFPNVKLIARVSGWDVQLVALDEGGARLEVRTASASRAGAEPVGPES